MTRPKVFAATAVLVTALSAGTAAVGFTATHQAPSEALAQSGPVVYQPPVQGTVTDPFRPPASAYGPGNRGIEYATTPGSSVVAAADGVVTFAGRVAGSLDVTVLHADGIRTSYVGLASTSVQLGQRVRGGEQIGTTGVSVHVGARRGDEYLDPASLWGSGRRGAILVPLDGG